jgi:hypothetical protein
LATHKKKDAPENKEKNDRLVGNIYVLFNFEVAVYEGLRTNSI